VALRFRLLTPRAVRGGTGASAVCAEEDPGRPPAFDRSAPLTRQNVRHEESSVVVALVAAVMCGCGSEGGGHATASKDTCTELIAAGNLMGPAVSELEQIPNSGADALRFVRDAERATHKALRKLPASAPNAAATKARSRLLSTLQSFSRQLSFATHRIEAGRTYQERSQAYVDAGAEITNINAATAAVISACRPGA
jgi:hypothetical protein